MIIEGDRQRGGGEPIEKRQKSWFKSWKHRGLIRRKEQPDHPGKIVIRPGGLKGMSGLHYLYWVMALDHSGH
jgi:hypothetical protein